MFVVCKQCFINPFFFLLLFILLFLPIFCFVLCNQKHSPHLLLLSGISLSRVVAFEIQNSHNMVDWFAPPPSLLITIVINKTQHHVKSDFNFMHEHEELAFLTDGVGKCQLHYIKFYHLIWFLIFTLLFSSKEASPTFLWSLSKEFYQN